MDGNRIDSFRFLVIGEDDREYGEDITYTICIGDDTYSSCLTMWCNDLSCIRDNLIDYLKTGMTVLKFDFDTDIHCVSLQRQESAVIVDVYPEFKGEGDKYIRRSKVSQFGRSKSVSRMTGKLAKLPPKGHQNGRFVGAKSVKT